MASLRTTLLAMLSSSFLVALGAGGCASSDQAPEDTEAGSSTDAVSPVVAGPLAKETDATVWRVTNQWADTTTPAAKQAGIAWPENSKLSWEEKFSAWIASFEKVERTGSYGNTFKTIRFQTPWGKAMEGPVLECADTATWLRLTFASWYHLPFYMTGSVNGRLAYFGHFGVVDSDGAPVGNFPRYATRYRDYEGTWKAGDAWNSDSTLQGQHVGNDDGAAGVDVGDGKLPDGAGAGAYFDKLFLNKRVGYLMILLDGYFGSANLADGMNMFHVKPESIAPGDALVERFGRTGIGHTLPVMSVERPKVDRYRVTVASGSMPRRQAVWEDPGESAAYFGKDVTGGEGESWDTPPVPYARLGAGLRRWRTPVLLNGRWNNAVPTADRDAYIPDSDLAAIAARPKHFVDLLAADSPEETRDTALSIIGTARTSLKEHPASCSTREKREEGFKLLYGAMEKLGKSHAEVDAQYRTLEDYVFADLEYNKSKTCCWNTTDAAMGEIILDLAAKEKAAADAAGTCKQPTVFAAQQGGYKLWKDHAATIGRAPAWRNWSEDEPCPQRDSQDDTLSALGNVAMCH